MIVYKFSKSPFSPCRQAYLHHGLAIRPNLMHLPSCHSRAALRSRTLDRRSPLPPLLAGMRLAMDFAMGWRLIRDEPSFLVPLSNLDFATDKFEHSDEVLNIVNIRILDHGF
ncbi:hypothetical protein L484_020949 [Morus notabilis]|uniref:Uncharacterized protein n=1 Tax=Morus notabilis TaxID=981085 RepID=W9QIJ1_9ROSA|nr:hypothetical protein L484_020949 [Morus notabilis]